MENNHREQNSEHPLEVEQSDPVNAEIRARPKSINTGPRTPPKPTTPPSVSASEPRILASGDCCPPARDITRKTLTSDAAPRYSSAASISGPTPRIKKSGERSTRSEEHRAAEAIDAADPDFAACVYRSETIGHRLT